MRERRANNIERVLIPLCGGPFAYGYDSHLAGFSTYFT